MSENRFRHLIGPALFEAAFVVLGVVLALAANEWRQNRADIAQANTALTEIVRELEANRQAVADSLEYHRGLVSRIMQVADDPAQLSIRDFSRGFIFPAQVHHTAWSSAAEIGALSNMSYDSVLVLSRVYAQQESYQEQAKSVGQIIYTELYRGGTAAIIANSDNLITILQTFAYREQQLLKTYNTLLSETFTEQHRQLAAD
ncbi:hypothetical protein [Arsukibacterium sp.]|uniref:hypothetical protein n=1 Tax=Arsukibacterium sp. TaxID=1977258 RepID=UPI00299E5FAC|nr:hypothetical protein [Arsukibacterium sp.]MDX1536962.1 hypothetical protein [Arsukibacterium sp.]